MFRIVNWFKGCALHTIKLYALASDPADVKKTRPLFCLVQHIDFASTRLTHSTSNRFLLLLVYNCRRLCNSFVHLFFSRALHSLYQHYSVN